jgi:O-phosphoseryl-tRNA(Cys) synthetase
MNELFSNFLEEANKEPLKTEWPSSYAEEPKPRTLGQIINDPWLQMAVLGIYLPLAVAAYFIFRKK